MGNKNGKNGKTEDKNKAAPSAEAEAAETGRNKITAVSDEARKVSTSDKSTATETRERPKRESYVKQLFDVRKKGKGRESTRTGAPISRYLPRFTIHYASIAFRNNNRTRDLRKCSALERQDLSERAETMVDELKSKIKEKNTSTRRVLERKAKSVDYFRCADTDEADVIFTALKIREDLPATNRDEPASNSHRNAELLVGFGKYSPVTSREKISKSINESKTNGPTKCKGISGHESRSAAPSPISGRDSDGIVRSRETDEAKGGDFQKNVDSRTKSQTANASKIDENYTPRHSSCKCSRNDKSRTVIHVESLAPKCKSGLTQVDNDFRESTTDRKSTAGHADLSSERTTKADEFSKIRYPKETRQAFMAMITDMKRSQLESERAGDETYTGIGENVRKFNKMCKHYEGRGKSPKPCEQRASEKKAEGNSARGETSCVQIKSLYARDDAKYRSESSLSIGISCRSIFYDRSREDARRCRSHRRRRNASPPVCRRNSSSFIESRTSLSTDVSYSRVRRLFQSIIAESRTGRLKRFRRNISGYKEMDRLGLGTWRNKQWRPSDSKAYTIYNKFQRNVSGFQGDFNRCRRKSEQ